MNAPDPCAGPRELLSAALDDELGLTERAELDQHLEACTDCRAVAERWSLLTRRVRVRSTEPIPDDLVDRVLARARPARRGRGGWIRPALAWVALVLAVQSVPPLVFGSIDGATVHVARHLGAFAMALAIGLLYAAWRPHRAFGLLPFAAALVATTFAGAVSDVFGGSRSAMAELLHLVELVGLVLLWMLAGSPGWERLRDGVRGLVPHRHGTVNG